MVRFGEELEQRGLLTMSQSLKGDASATRVRGRGDSAVVTDGPFAEAEGQRGGAGPR